jgi:hypothetical protein
MTEYLNYWRPERFHLAFPAGQGMVKNIAAARYSRLVPGDVLWLLTRGRADAPLLTGRLEVSSHPRPVAVPHYAHGNSRQRDHKAVSIAAGSALRMIPVGWSQMKALRFDSANDRIVNAGMRAFEGELASLRKLTGASSTKMREWWNSPPTRSSDSEVAAAFGDLETNRQIEKAAVALIIQDYRRQGWTVKSRERDRVGYDLECSRGALKELVEVKGRRGSSQQVIVTHGELREARSRANWILCIVTNAMTKPRIHRYEGAALADHFDLKPLAHQLILKR